MLKNLKKLSVAVMVCCLFTLNIQSQELISLVPRDCFISGMIDLKQIDAKANLMQIVKLPMLKKLNGNLLDFVLGQSARMDSTSILDLKEHGVSTSTKSWFYVKKSPELYYGAIILALDNEPAFSAYIQQSIRKEDSITIMNAGDYKYFNNHKLNVAWNTKLVAFYGAGILPSVHDSIQKELESGVEVDYYNNFLADTTVVEEIEEPYEEINPSEDELEIIDEDETTQSNDIEDSSLLNEVPPIENDSIAAYDYYNNSDDTYYTRIKIVQQKCDSIVSFWCSTNASIFLKDNGAKSVSGNQMFMDYIKDNPDAAFILDYGFIADMGQGYKSLGMFNSSLTSFYSDFMKEYYKNLFMMGKAKLNQDDMQFSYEMLHSEKMKTIYKEIKKHKISKKFLSYLGKDVMAYGAVGIDIPGYSKGIGNLMREVYPTIPNYGEIFGISMDILDIIIDQEALYSVFTGDMVVALNGIKPVQVTHTAYDYDDNYNMTERIDTTTQMQPEVLFMAGIGNVDDVRKILKLSVATKVFSLENGLYSLAYGGADLPIYMKIHDDILFISNNKSFVENPVVLAKNKQLSKEHFKMFKKNTGVVFANTGKIAMEALSQGLSDNKKMLAKSGDLFKTVKMTAGQKNGKSFGNFTLQLSKTNDNSLTDIFNFLNELFLSKTSRFD